MAEAMWTDQHVMPWGIHKGKKLVDIPPSYLLWLYEQTWIKDWHGLYLYLKKNEDLLLAEKIEDQEDGEEDLRTFEDYKDYR